MRQRLLLEERLEDSHNAHTLRTTMEIEAASTADKETSVRQEPRQYRQDAKPHVKLGDEEIDNDDNVWIFKYTSSR